MVGLNQMYERPGSGFVNLMSHKAPILSIFVTVAFLINLKKKYSS